MDVDGDNGDWITTAILKSSPAPKTTTSDLSKQALARDSPIKLAQQIFSGPKETPPPKLEPKSVPSDSVSPNRKKIVPRRMSGSRFKGAQKSSPQNGPPHSFYLPYVLMGYLQLAFNLVIAVSILYAGLSVYYTLRKEVDLKVNEKMKVLLAEIESCRRHYQANRCTERVPATEAACSAWEACLQKNPTFVSRARLSAETFAEILEGFIEPISYKSMCFVLVAAFGAILISNLAFSLVRGRVRPAIAYHNDSDLMHR